MKFENPAAAVIGTCHPADRFLKSVFLAVVLLAAGMPYAMATDYYVDGLNGSNTNAGTQDYPFLTPWKAWTVAVAGDTIHLVPSTTYGPLWFGPTAERPTKTGGAPGAYITIRGTGTPGNMTKVSGKGENFGLMLDKSSYVRLQNLDITAPGHGDISGWSGFYIKSSHHVDVVNNYAHHAGCTGIQTHHADYVRIIGNRVADNAKVVHNNVFCSGISLHDNLNTDTNTGVKMEVAHNFVYGNTNIKPNPCTSPCTNSDGNGIIIDDSRRLQASNDKQPYTGATLVENNVVFGNGGRGVSIYQSDHVTVRGNTFYHNNKDPDIGAWRPGEAHVNKSGGVNLYNNIFFSAGSAPTAATGEHVAISLQNSSGAPIVVNYNLSYNPKNVKRLHIFQANNQTTVDIGKVNKWGNPRHHSPSLDPSLADFRVKSDSPALGYKSPSNTYPKVDYLYDLRTSPVTVGAYQIPVASTITQNTRK